MSKDDIRPFYSILLASFLVELLLRSSFSMQKIVLNCLHFLLKMCTLRTLHKRSVNLTSPHLSKKFIKKAIIIQFWWVTNKISKCQRTTSSLFFTSAYILLVELLLLRSSFSVPSHWVLRLRGVLSAADSHTAVITALSRANNMVWRAHYNLWLSYSCGCTQ